MTSSERLLGSASVFLGAVLFSAKAIMVKLALPYGVDAVSLLLLRMLFALPIYVAIAIWLHYRAKKSGTPISVTSYLPQLIALGMVGYYLASYFDFAGLEYIPASLERVILYLYPTIVLLISGLFLKKSVSQHQWIAIALCYAGVWVAIRFGVQIDTTENYWWGIGLIFLSAITYAVYLVGSGELIPKVGVWTFTSYAMIVSSICVCIHFLLTTRPSTLFQHSLQVYWYGLAMAIFATVIPSFLISAGIKRIGAGNAAIIGGIGPVSTIVLASIFLGETFSTAQIIGTAIVILGVVYISVNMKR